MMNICVSGNYRFTQPKNTLNASPTFYLNKNSPPSLENVFENKNNRKQIIKDASLGLECEPCKGKDLNVQLIIKELDGSYYLLLTSTTVLDSESYEGQPSNIYKIGDDKTLTRVNDPEEATNILVKAVLLEEEGAHILNGRIIGSSDPNKVY